MLFVFGADVAPLRVRSGTFGRGQFEHHQDSTSPKMFVVPWMIGNAGSDLSDVTEVRYWWYKLFRISHRHPGNPGQI